MARFKPLSEDAHGVFCDYGNGNAPDDCVACLRRAHEAQLADLQRQLREAQEERGQVGEIADEYKRQLLVVSVDRDRLKAERDAAHERGTRACEEIQYLYMRWREAYEADRLGGRMVLAAERKAEAAEALVKVLHDGLELAGHRVHQYDRHIQSFALCDQYPCDGIKPLLALTPAEVQAQREDSDAGH